MQTTPGAAAMISGQIRSRRRGRGRILFRGRRGGDLGGAGGGPTAGLELQVHGGGVPCRFRARWRAPAEYLHGYGGAASVRETEVRGEIERKEERQGEGEGARSGGEVLVVPVSYSSPPEWIPACSSAAAGSSPRFSTSSRCSSR